MAIHGQYMVMHGNTWLYLAIHGQYMVLFGDTWLYRAINGYTWLYMAINIFYVIASAAYGVLFTSCLCQKPERARYERVRAFDTNNE